MRGPYISRSCNFPTLLLDMKVLMGNPENSLASTYWPPIVLQQPNFLLTIRTDHSRQWINPLLSFWLSEMKIRNCPGSSLFFQFNRKPFLCSQWNIPPLGSKTANLTDFISVGTRSKNSTNRLYTEKQ